MGAAGGGKHGPAFLLETTTKKPHHPNQPFNLFCASEAFPPLHPTGCRCTGADHRVPSNAGEPLGGSVPPQLGAAGSPQPPGTPEGSDGCLLTGTERPQHGRALCGCLQGCRAPTGPRQTGGIAPLLGSPGARVGGRGYCCRVSGAPSAPS